MGADIYLNSVHEPARKKAERNFDKWVKARDALPPGPEKEKAQEKVEHYYDAMYEHGYFRDSYNGSSLFWMLGLSWWGLSEELCDKEGNLSIENAKVLLDRLRNTSVDALFPGWEAAKREEGWPFDDDENSPEAWAQHFKDKKARFEALLEQSIELNEPLYWSV
jgi:hypothetical protein